MSTASAAPGAEAAPPKAGSKKKLLIIVAAVVLLLVAGGGAAVLYVLKSRAAAASAEDGDLEPLVSASTHAPALDAKHAPTYMPLDPFTVNLADRDADRYAQVAVSLELADSAQADVIKAYMPAVRNNILMLLSHKTSAELLHRDGKAQLAEQIRKETARALGFEIEDGEDPPKKKRRGAPPLPVSAVFFSTFIIQ
jgi:flagellar FliL protein